MNELTWLLRSIGLNFSLHVREMEMFCYKTRVKKDAEKETIGL